ncbi:MAG: hypothetical protein L6R36_002481 [Xanthoria steineri]|nr:MAG: hypothetical protein L6R36_002481 [Xanthoria steineri]
MAPAATVATPPDLNVAERGLAYIQQRNRRIRRALESARYPDDIEPLMSLATGTAPLPETSAAKTTAPVSLIVPGRAPRQIPEHYYGYIKDGYIKGFDAEAASSTKIQAATTLANEEAHSKEISGRYPGMPGAVDIFEKLNVDERNLLFGHDVDGGLQGSRMWAKAKKTDRAVERALLHKCLTKAEPAQREQSVDHHQSTVPGTQAISEKDLPGAQKLNGKPKQNEDDDWVIVTDPRELYVVVHNTTTRQKEA